MKPKNKQVLHCNDPDHCEVCSPSPGRQKPAEKADLKILIEKTSELIGRNPQKAATILTEWLQKSERPAYQGKKPFK